MIVKPECKREAKNLYTIGMNSAMIQDIQAAANPVKAEFLARFFKTGKGQYAEGDIFLGITVPQQRIIAKKYNHLTLSELGELLQSNFHEHRLIALLILVHQYRTSSRKQQEIIAEFYLQHTNRINNWDLVDSSADKILGAYLFDKDRKILYTLVKSTCIWERRIAVLATFYFIKQNDFDDALNIYELLLDDSHDLIHKAVGWMLRELGKRDINAELNFLENHYKHMPRTMLRYAIEKLIPSQKQHFMKK